jgi:iron complex transport system substrate-binding protein
MRRLLVALILLAPILAIPTTVGARSPHSPKSFPVTIVDDTHHSVTITARPARIVSLDPRDTETLFALGMEKRVVADGSQYVEGAAGISTDFTYPAQWPSRWGRDYPVKAKTLPHIEGGFGQTPFNLELVESLHPDLVFSLNSDAPTLQKMRDLGLKVVVLDPANLNGIYHDISLVGAVTGARKQAKVVVAAIKRQIKSVRARLASVHTTPSVYYEIDATNPTEPYTAGAGTFIDEAIHIAKGANVGDAVTTCSGTTCYPQLSLEALVKLDPQVIELGDAAYGETPGKVKARSGWESIAAVKNGRVYPFDDSLISRAGPRIAIGITKLARSIHPEAFKARKPRRR